MIKDIEDDENKVDDDNKDDDDKHDNDMMKPMLLISIFSYYTSYLTYF
jgi:hypothetical protein